MSRQRARVTNWSGRAFANRLTPAEIVTIGADAAAMLSRGVRSLVACYEQPGRSPEAASRADGGPRNGGPRNESNGTPPRTKPIFACVEVEVPNSLFESGLDETTAADIIERFGGLCVLVPLVWDGRTIGIVAIQTEANEDVSELIPFGTVLAEQIALALQISRFSTPPQTQEPVVDQGVPAVEVNGRLTTNVPQGPPQESALAIGSGAPIPTTDAATQTILSSVAHDLRSPLAMVQMYAEYLHGQAGPESRTALSQVRMACRHLDAMIRNLLDYKMLESGGRVVRVRPADPVPTIEDAVSLSLAGAERTEVPVVLHTRRPVLLDHDILRQVLVNLVSNAMKFTPPDRAIRITVRDEPVDGRAGSQQRVAIEVQDEGTGIDPEALPKIFTPYYRTRSGEGFSGLGLGLAISHVLTEKMGGVLQVLSEVGVGSTFRVVLPAAPAVGGPEQHSTGGSDGDSELRRRGFRG